MNDHRTVRTSGFTLIELLVVIAIIGVLASIILASLNTARVKARDARRVADLHVFRTALDLFSDDHNGAYPAVCNYPTNRWVSFDSPPYVDNHVCTQSGTDLGTLSEALAPYVRALQDPRRVASAPDDSGYVYTANGPNNWCAMIWLTPENLNNYAPNLVNGFRCSGITSDGQCIINSLNPSFQYSRSTPPNPNSVYVGEGLYAGGC